MAFFGLTDIPSCLTLRKIYRESWAQAGKNRSLGFFDGVQGRGKKVHVYWDSSLSFSPSEGPKLHSVLQSKIAN